MTLQAERAALFTDYTEAAVSMLNNMDDDALAPGFADVIRCLQAPSTKFIPAELRDGIVSIPYDRVDEDGFALLPLLAGDPETLTLHHSAQMQSLRRVTVMAKQLGLPAGGEGTATIEAIYDPFIRSDSLTIPSPREKTGAITHIASMPIKTNLSEKTLMYQSRPLIVVGQESTALPLEVTASDIIHEDVHGEDFERRPAMGTSEAITPRESLAEHVRHELRGYHGGVVALKGYFHPALKRAIEIETMRASDADPRDPFMPTQARARYLLQAKAL